MRADGIVIRNIRPNSEPQGSRILVTFDVNVLILQTSEKSLRTHIVQRTSLTIHGNLHSTARQQFQIVFIGEVAPLVGVDHFRTSAGQRPIQAAHDKALVQTDADLVIHYAATVPVEHNKQIQKSFL